MGPNGDDDYLQSSTLVFFDFGGTTESFTLFHPGPENPVRGGSERHPKALGLQALQNARATRSGSFQKQAEAEEEEGEEDCILPPRDEVPDIKSNGGTDHIVKASSLSGVSEEEEEEEDNGGGLEEEGENGGGLEEDPDPVSLFGNEKVNEKLGRLADIAGVGHDDGQPADALLAKVIIVLKDLEEKSCLIRGTFSDDVDEQFVSLNMD